MAKKKSRNFYLSPEALTMLKDMAHSHGISQAGIVEIAIRNLYLAAFGGEASSTPSGPDDLRFL